MGRDEAAHVRDRGRARRRHRETVPEAVQLKRAPSARGDGHEQPI